jgi:hypothetical protein
MDNFIQNKTVAIIGSAGELDSNNYSNIINNIDIIVRINVKTNSIDKIILTDNIIKNTTSRTDIIYHNGVIENEKWQGYSKQVTSNSNAIISEQNICIYNKNNIKYLVIVPFRFIQCNNIFKKIKSPLNLKLYEFHNNRLNSKVCLTTGLYAIYDILQYSPKKLYIFGFDCYKGLKKNYDNYVIQGINNNEDPQQYYMPQNNNSNFGSHNFDIELNELYNIYINNLNKLIITEHLTNIFKKI